MQTEPAPLVTCPEHGISSRLCGCAAPAETSAPLRELVRDYTIEPIGKSTRGAVRGTIELCPGCDRNGVHVLVCSRRGRRHDIWVHEAVITSRDGTPIGYTSHDTCHRYGPPPAPRKARKKTRSGS